MSQVTLNVPDISCEHCERAIVNALQDRPGVNMVKVSIPNKTVNLDYDESKLNLQEVSSILDEEGYTVAGTQTV